MKVKTGPPHRVVMIIFPLLQGFNRPQPTLLYVMSHLHLHLTVSIVKLHPYIIYRARRVNQRHSMASNSADHSMRLRDGAQYAVPNLRTYDFEE